MKLKLLKMFIVKSPRLLAQPCAEAEVEHLLTLKINIFCPLYNYTARGREQVCNAMPFCVFVKGRGCGKGRGGGGVGVGGAVTM